MGDRYAPLDLSLQRQRTLEVLVDLLGRLTRERPVLEVYEDVHRSDPSTLDLLDLLVERVGTFPALVLIMAATPRCCRCAVGLQADREKRAGSGIARAEHPRCGLEELDRLAGPLLESRDRSTLLRAPALLPAHDEICGLDAERR